MKFKNFVYPVLILPNQIPELTGVVLENDGVKVGAAVTLTEMERVLDHYIDILPGKICSLILISLPYSYP